MIVSHRRQFVLLLPWKCASQTLRLRLAAHDESPYSPFFHFHPGLNRVVHQHLTCADFLCLPEAKLGYLVAGFVRNPYDRVMSGFRQLQHDAREQPQREFPAPWIRDLVCEQIAENFALLCRAGFDFDRWVSLLGEQQILEAGRNTNFPLHPAHYWTHVAGRQVAGFIGRVERFEEDFDRFLARAGIEDAPRGNENVADLAGDSAGNPFGYRYAARMSPRSRARIHELFRDDFEIFGYERVM